MLAEGIDPGEQRKAHAAATLERSENTFAAVADELLRTRATKLARGTAIRECRLLESDLAPYIGSRPIADMTALELLAALRRIEERGAVETAHRARMLAGQVFKYASATGRVPTNYNPATDLVGALSQPEGRNFATVYDPKKGRDDLGRAAVVISMHATQTRRPPSAPMPTFSRSPMPSCPSPS